MKLILVSGLKQRQDILKNIGLKYEIIKSQEEDKSEEKELNTMVFVQ